MTDQLIELITTRTIPAILFMGFVCGLIAQDNDTQQKKMQDEIREGKIDTAGKGLW